MRTPRLATLTPLMLLAPAFAFANEGAGKQPPDTAAKREKIGLYALSYGEYRPSADLRDGASGSVRRTVWDGEIIHSGEVAQGTRLDLDYEAKWTHNDFRGVTPYGDTETHFFGAHVAHMISSEWGAGVVGAIEFASETSADLFRDGLRGGGGLTAVWKPSASVSLETGAMIQSQFGRTPRSLPYLRWKWAVNPHLDLEARVTGLQNGVSATWYLTDNKATSLKLTCFYETAAYALHEGAGADGVSTGELPLRLTATQFLNETLFVAARAEIILCHREGFYANDTKLAGFETEVAPAFGLLVGLRL